MVKSTFAKRLIGLASAAALSAAASLPLSRAASAADSYTFDKDHTKVLFAYNHVGLSTQTGRFDDLDGTLVFDQETPENSSIEVTIQAASLDTDVPALDQDLLSENFFDAKQFPVITFKSTSVRQTGKNTGQVTGDLTIRDKTKPVTLDVTFNFAGEHPLSPFLEKYKDAQYVAFSARTTLLRSDFDVGKFAPLTSDAVELMIETELRKVE